MKNTYVIARFTFEGLHHWLDASRSTEGYLEHPHRHIFHVEVKKQVWHTDREVEFINFGRVIKAHCEREFGMQTAGCTTFSCEHMASSLMDIFHLTSCKVFEDNENGAEVTYGP